MIVIVGRPGLGANGELDRPTGQIAFAAAAPAATWSLSAASATTPQGDAVVVALGRAGIGHAAILRDPAGSTPTTSDDGANDDDARLPRLDAGDVDLGLRYLPECRVLIVAEPLPEDALRVVVEAAAYHGAELIVIGAASDLPDSCDGPRAHLQRAEGRSPSWWRATPWPSTTGARPPTRGAMRSTRLAGSRRASDGTDGPAARRLRRRSASNTTSGRSIPLTPRRFGPSIDLMRTRRRRRTSNEPRVATDDELQPPAHARYIATVRRFSDDPDQPSEAGIGPGDCPPFENMHDVLRSRGRRLDRRHRPHPCTETSSTRSTPAAACITPCLRRASGFCIYNDVALAVARARDAGHRVLYVDLDVHHGDGTQAMFWDDPQVLTFSIHETPMTLFPGTGFVDEDGGDHARGTAVNVPVQPYTGDESWLAAVTSGCSRACRRVPANVPGHAARLRHARLRPAGAPTPDDARVSRGNADARSRSRTQHAGGRWLATGGGGYDAYRVVPRSWSLVWLAQAHRDSPDRDRRGLAGQMGARGRALRPVAAADVFSRP